MANTVNTGWLKDHNPVLRYAIDHPSMNGSASIGFSVIVGDRSTSFTESAGTNEVYVTKDDCNLFPESYVVQEVISYAKANKVLPEIRLSLRTDVTSLGSSQKSGSTASAYITQAYLEIIYEDALSIGVSHKVDGEWKQAQSAYQKQNSVWVEITEDECKNLLSNSLCGK